MKFNTLMTRLAGPLLALAASTTGAHANQQSAWTQFQLGAASDAQPAEILRGDGDLNGSRFNPTLYEFVSIVRVVNQRELVLYTRLEAKETGGDRTWLRMPTKRTVLYSAPRGKLIAEARSTVPLVLSEYGRISILPGLQHLGLMDWTARSDNEFVTYWGDQWGDDTNALEYFTQVGFRVKLVAAPFRSPQNLRRPHHRPSRPWTRGPRRGR